MYNKITKEVELRELLCTRFLYKTPFFTRHWEILESKGIYFRKLDELKFFNHILCSWKVNIIIRY